MELAFAELESSATEDEVAAKRAVAKTTNAAPFTRKCPARQPSRASAAGAGGRAGSDGSSMLRQPATEQIERGYHRDAGGRSTIQHVHEKFTCRDCEKISQGAGPFKG
jgi:hypothetical protein